MKRRSVLSGVGAAIGVSVSGCLNSGGKGGNGEGDTEEGPPWLRRVRMDIDREGRKAKLVASIKQDSDVSEVSLHGPDGSLVTTAVVGNNQRRVGLAEVDVQTISPYFYGLQPGTYEISGLTGGTKTEREAFDLVPELSVTNVSLAVESAGGKEWVSGFRSSLSNPGMYPYVFKEFGALDGVPNPPKDGKPPSAVPTEEDDDIIVWPSDTQSFGEGREDGGSLVTPKEEGTPDQELIDELTAERTATLEYATTEESTTVEVDYTLSGDLVTTESGYAMSGGEVLEVRGSATSESTEDG